MNKILLTKVWATLHEADVSDKCCGETLLDVVYMRKRIITALLNMETPIEMLLGKAPDNLRIKIFGRATYVLIHKATRKRKVSNRLRQKYILDHQTAPLGCTTQAPGKWCTPDT